MDNWISLPASIELDKLDELGDRFGTGISGEWGDDIGTDGTLVNFTERFVSLFRKTLHICQTEITVIYMVLGFTLLHWYTKRQHFIVPLHQPNTFL